MLAPDLMFGILGLGFSLGLLHAFDADHIMAVSALVNRQTRGEAPVRSARKAARYCLSWALGHGGILLLVVIALTGFGLELPAAIMHLAEKLIGVFLIVLGGWIIYQIWRSNIRLQLHHHGELSHIHLTDTSGVLHDHQPLLVGMTHGLAGSAPLLALLPTLGSQSMAAAIGYIALFCAGVIVSMVVFGLLLGSIQGWLARFGQRVFQLSRLVIGCLSIGVGTWWLLA